MQKTLFHRNKNGSINQWQITVEQHETYSEIIVVYGGVDSTNKIASKTRVEQGKNLSRQNKTTHFEQANKEALAKWKKKKELEGYCESIDELDLLHNYQPMLAHDYLKHPDKLSIPCFIQPKLDGYRMIYHDGRCLSRQNKEYSILKHTLLFRELSTIDRHLTLDGELYIHGSSFEQLGILRKKKISSEQDAINLEKIEYHVYDMIDLERTFSQRHDCLRRIFQDFSFTRIRLVQTEEIKESIGIKSWHDYFVDEMYEGSILRNHNGRYRCKYRSYDLLKYKDFMDSEFSIVDYDSEADTTGDHSDLIVWICQTRDGNKFSVRPKGTHLERKKLYQECRSGQFTKYKDRMLWVKYFELTDRGVPRFPTTKTDSFLTYIRDVIL
jgi:DNA ligase-1